MRRKPDPRFRLQPPQAVAAIRARYGLPERYLFAFGTIEPRKNLIRPPATFEVLYAGWLSETLVIEGRRGWLYEDFFAALERSPACGAVLFPGYVADKDLLAIYAGAQALACWKRAIGPS